MTKEKFTFLTTAGGSGGYFIIIYANPANFFKYIC